MPRRKLLEAAVPSSPLFLLSAEIRTMIYRLLLTIQWPIKFAERHGRPSPTLRRVRPVHLSPLVHDLYPEILRTCRLIHREACPLLYRGNNFHFREPLTSDSFRWSTGAENAAWVEEIGLTFWRSANFTWWSEYICRKKFNFQDNFPHLKRLTITLVGGLLIAETKQLRSDCELIGQNIRGLASVRIVGLNDESVIEAFKPMVERLKTSPRDSRNVQANITEFPAYVGWKNVTIWWGHEGKRPSHAASEPEIWPNLRRRLFRIGTGPNFTYATGESYLPESPC